MHWVYNTVEFSLNTAIYAASQIMNDPNIILPYYMWLSEQKPDMLAHKLKSILLPQLIATLNKYACSLPLLANVDWSAFPECFLLTM